MIGSDIARKSANWRRSASQRATSFWKTERMAEVLFEFVRQGNFVKVTAIESETRIEASVIVPVSLSQQQMQIQALQKLKYVLQKQAEE